MVVQVTFINIVIDSAGITCFIAFEVSTHGVGDDNPDIFCRVDIVGIIFVCLDQDRDMLREP